MTKPSSSSFDETREQLHRQMLSAVSHDLKTPLATVIGSLEIYSRMHDKLTYEKKNMLIESALMEAYRLDNFITNILDMARLENDMIKIAVARCELSSLMQDCLTRLGPRREKGTITLSPLGSDTVIFSDPMLVGRATAILLENALKHAGANPIITVEYGVENNRSIIRVRDNGGGIPKGKEEEVFSKFTRLKKRDQQNAGKAKGTDVPHAGHGRTQIHCELPGWMARSVYRRACGGQRAGAAAFQAATGRIDARLTKPKQGLFRIVREKNSGA